MVDCKHCGTPFSPILSKEDEFCCHGCAAVYRLIHDQGFEQYYALKEDRIDPVRPSVLEQRDYQWLARAQSTVEQEAGSAGTTAQLTLDLMGISCMGCVWLVEKLFLRCDGAVRAEVNAQYGQVRLHWRPGTMDLTRYAVQLQRFGYLLAPAGKRVHTESTKLTARMAVCGAFAMNAMLFTLPSYLGMERDFELAGLFELLTFLFATLSLVTGGSYFMVRAWQGLRHGILHIDLPIALGVSGAYIGSVYGWLRGLEDFLYFDFVAIFVFLMLVGRWTQEWAVERNRNSVIRQSLKPDTVTVLQHPDPGFSGNQLRTEDLMPGVHYVLPAGQTVPVASELTLNTAPFSLEWINGETEVRTWQPGREVPSGALTLAAQPVVLIARESWQDSLLHRLLRHSELSPRNPILERVLKYYLCAVLVVAFVGSGAWLYFSADLQSSLQVALSILVVSCPCALGVAYPLTNELAIARLRRYGVFVREETVFGRLPGIRSIIFDKTGTLTLELPELLEPDALHRLHPGALAVMRQLTSASLHPVSRALRMALRKIPDTEQDGMEGVITESAGQGVSMRIQDSLWSLGRPGWRGGLADESGASSGWQYDCELCRDGVVVARFAFAEAVREDARTEIDWLRRFFRISILSGDRQAKVEAMADRLGLPREAALAGQSPDEKSARVVQLGKGTTLFIGDGANDSLAFDAAAVRGTPVMDRGILENKADFLFMGRGLSGIRILFQVSQRRAAVLRNVMIFAISYNLLAVTICLAGQMNPLLAAVLMPLSSLFSLVLVARGMRWRKV